MRKKSIEELRAGNAERQKRWRAKHRWLAKERKLALYGKSAADKRLGIDGPMTAEEEHRYEDMALVEGEPEVVRANARVVSRRTGRAIPEGLMEPEQRGGQGDVKNIRTTDEREAGATDTGGPAAETAEEKRVAGALEEFKAKVRARERRGVAVKLRI